MCFFLLESASVYFTAISFGFWWWWWLGTGDPRGGGVEVSARRCHPELSGPPCPSLRAIWAGSRVLPWVVVGSCGCLASAQSHLSLASGACCLHSPLCRLFCCVTYFWEAPAHCSLLGLVVLAVGTGPWARPWHGLLLFPAYLTKWMDLPKTPTCPWGQLTHSVGFGTSVTCLPSLGALSGPSLPSEMGLCLEF